MRFLDHVHQCNRHDLGRLRPFVVAETPLGWVRGDHCALLADMDVPLTVSAEGVRLATDPGTPAERSTRMAEVAATLAGHGLITLRHEAYRVGRDFLDPPLFWLDRGAVPFFGIRAYGVHLNGLTHTEDGTPALWIARRSPTKPVEPNKLDNLVAGGLPNGYTALDNLCKEAAEEADIPEPLARSARPVGLVRYCLEEDRGLKPDTLFCYDLSVPDSFTPRNTDGELVGFQRLSIPEVMERLRSPDIFKRNVNLVILDFLIRHGYITPDNEPDYAALVSGLRAPLP